MPRLASLAGMPEAQWPQHNSCHRVGGYPHVKHLPLPGPQLPMPGSDLHAILQAIGKDRIFGLTQLDVHQTDRGKDKFCDLPPILMSTTDGPFMWWHWYHVLAPGGPYQKLLPPSDADTHPTAVLILAERWSIASISCCNMIGDVVSNSWPRAVLRSGGTPSRSHHRLCPVNLQSCCWPACIGYVWEQHTFPQDILY